MAPSKFKYVGVTRAHFDEQEVSLNSRVELCSNKADLRSFLDSEVNNKMIYFLWRQTVGLGENPSSRVKRILTNEICDWKFPNETEESVDLNSFDGKGGPKAALAFCARVLASNNVDALDKTFTRSFVAFTERKVREGRMPEARVRGDPERQKRSAEYLFAEGVIARYQQYKDAEPLKEWQMRLLRAVGFVFSQRFRNFSQNIQAVHMLIQGTGLLYVPRNGYAALGLFHYKLDTSLRKLEELDNDLDRYAEFRQESRSNQIYHIVLTEEHLELVEYYELDFRLRPTRGADKDKIDAEHRVWFGKVSQFKKDNGHFNVPFSLNAPIGLVGMYEWVHDVRLNAFPRSVYPDDFDYPEDADDRDDQTFIYPGDVDYPEGAERNDKGKQPLIRRATLVLPDDVLDGLTTQGFPDFIQSYVRARKKEARAETAFFYELDAALRAMTGEHFLDNATVDSSFEDGGRYRPDLAYSFNLSRCMNAELLIEFDEAMHTDRTVESEQRKVIKELICCNKNGIKYVHLIRINGGCRRIPDPGQVKAAATVLHEELYGDGQALSGDITEKLQKSGRKMYVRVTLLDFDENHYHVNAYEVRQIPTNVEVKKVESADDWETLLPYDEVVKIMSGAPLF